MKINEVIERHGMQLRDVSRVMGLKPSALQSAIDRNLTVKTLRLISEAAKIPIAEFFSDELEAMGLMITARPSSAEETKDTTASQVNKAAAAPNEGAEQGAASTGAAPEAPNQRAEEVRAVRFQYGCPHCGHQIQVCISEV